MLLHKKIRLQKELIYFEDMYCKFIAFLYLQKLYVIIYFSSSS